MSFKKTLKFQQEIATYYGTQPSLKISWTQKLLS